MIFLFNPFTKIKNFIKRKLVEFLLPEINRIEIKRGIEFYKLLMDNNNEK